MATNCPKCKNGTLKKGEKMVYCSDYKPRKKENGDWTNEGKCDFRITFANKVFGSINAKQIKELVDGKTVTNKKGDTIVLDLEKEFFTSIEFAQKEEDEDL